METRHLRLLAVLVAFWVLTGAYRWATYAPPQRVPLKFAKGARLLGPAGGGEGGRGGAKPHSDFSIRLDLVRPERPPLPQEAKNIFTPLIPVARPAPALPPPPIAVPPPPVAPPPRPSPEEEARARAREELGEFRYLGILERREGDQAFLARGKELFIVEPGETINGRYLLKELNANRALLVDRETQVQMTLMLAPDSSP